MCPGLNSLKKKKESLRQNPEPKDEKLAGVLNVSFSLSRVFVNCQSEEFWGNPEKNALNCTYIPMHKHKRGSYTINLVNTLELEMNDLKDDIIICEQSESSPDMHSMGQDRGGGRNLRSVSP